MKAIRHLLPHENIIYFGDTAHLPYGTKSRETILRYSLEIATFLSEQKIKILVVACHTACSFALAELQTTLKIPVIGITTPTIEKVVQSSTSGKIAILGTRGTISSGMYQKSIQTLAPQAQVLGIPCQLLVSLVEEGFLDHPLTHLALREYFKPLDPHDIDTLVLGCTHFPLLIEPIQKALPSHINIIDPSHLCAETVKNYLHFSSLLNPVKAFPTDQFFVSDDPEKFRLLGTLFLDRSIESVLLYNSLLKDSQIT